MYSVILNDGKVIDINANLVESIIGEKNVRFYNENLLVARFSTDNIAGWVNTDYRVDASGFVIFKEDEK